MTDESIAVGGIYSITNTISGRKYVGSSVNIKQRWVTHRRSLINGRHENSRLQAAFKKYGIEAFVFAVIEVVPDLSTMLEREQYWLDELAVAKHGYNISPTAGNRTGVKMSDESRAKMSSKAKGRIITPEHRAKLSAAMKGYQRTPEHRAKLGASRKGRAMPNISAALKGIPKSPEAVEKQRRSLTGRKQPADEIARRAASMVGHAVSEETRAKIAAANKGRVKTPEEIAKISATLKGRKHSPETIAKRKIAVAKTYALRKALREISN